VHVLASRGARKQGKACMCCMHACLYCTLPADRFAMISCVRVHGRRSEVVNVIDVRRRRVEDRAGWPSSRQDLAISVPVRNASIPIPTIVTSISDHYHCSIAVRRIISRLSMQSPVHARDRASANDATPSCVLLLPCSTVCPYRLVVIILR
jgi:hypothetical protein